MPKFNIEKFATRIVSKLVPERLFDDLSLEQQVYKVHRAIGLMSVLPNSSLEKATAEVRKRILDGMPNDIKKMYRGGKTEQEIKTYYWSCEQFVALWTVIFKMEEATLDVLINDSIKEV